jgi:hypothetical protein
MLGALAAVRTFVQPTRDAWALIGADADGAIVYARLSVSDTGLLDQQLTTRFLLLPVVGDAVEHRATHGPAAPDGPGFAAGTDSLLPTPGGWELRIGGDGLGSRVQVADAAPGCPPTPGTMTGFVEDEVDGRLLTGPGIVVHTHARGHVDDTALYVLGNHFTAGIDPLADCPAWARIGTDSWTGEPAPFTIAPGVVIAMGPWTVTVRGVASPVDQDAWAHILPPERWLAWLAGQQAPHVEARRVLLHVEGPGVSTLAPGLALRRH